MNNTVTFIIPLYNMEKYLQTCINSILKQTIDDWELILVDDGSTDRTAVLCDAYAEKDERIRVIHQRNAGSAAARNSGMDMAKGEWLAFIDGDDWIEETYLETLQPYMQECYDFLMYSYKEVQGTNKKSMLRAEKEFLLEGDTFRLLVKDVIDTEKRLSEVAASRSQFWTKLYRKQFLLENQVRSDTELRMSQDVMFNLCVYNLAKRALFLPKELYNYRILDDSTCHRYSEEQVPRILKTMEAIGAYVDKTGLGQEGELLYQKRILVSLVNACRLDFCHKSNPAKYTMRRRRFLELRAKEPFCTTLNPPVIRSFSFRKQVCMWLVKFKCFGLLSVFLS